MYMTASTDTETKSSDKILTKQGSLLIHLDKRLE